MLVECGRMLSKNDYRIKVLNTINFAKSMHYNPFAYIRSEKDILKLVNTIIVNTKGEGQQASEDFWVKAEKLYYTALIAYIWYEAPEEEQNFSMLIDLVDASEAREDDENFKNAVDLLFEELEQTCDRVALINNGHIADIANMQDIRNRKNKDFKLEFNKHDDYARFLEAGYPIKRLQEQYNQVTITVATEDTDVLLKTLRGYDVRFISELPYTLEKHFKQILQTKKETENNVQ